MVTGEATPEEFVDQAAPLLVAPRPARRARRRFACDGSPAARATTPRCGACTRSSTPGCSRRRSGGSRGRLPATWSTASRDLFFDLLGPVAAEQGKPVLVEMSCFTIASAPGLARIFPEARFVHSVRDGRDSGSSKVSKRQKAHHPTDVASGIEWWEGRLRLAEAGYRGLPDPAALHAVCLDELVWGDREASYEGLLSFLGVDDEPGMRAFFDEQMNADAAHRERWREGRTEAEQEASGGRVRRRARPDRARGLSLRGAAEALVRARGRSPSLMTSEAGEAGLRRRHRPQRHPHRRPAAGRARRGARTCRSRRAFTATSAGCRDLLEGRVTPGRLHGEAARLLVAPGAGRRPAARPLQPDARRRRSTRRRTGSRPAITTIRSAPAGGCSSTCSGAVAESSASPAWSR